MSEYSENYLEIVASWEEELSEYTHGHCREILYGHYYGPSFFRTTFNFGSFRIGLGVNIWQRRCSFNAWLCASRSRDRMHKDDWNRTKERHSTEELQVTKKNRDSVRMMVSRDGSVHCCEADYLGTNKIALIAAGHMLLFLVVFSVFYVLPLIHNTQKAVKRTRRREIQATVHTKGESAEFCTWSTT